MISEFIANYTLASHQLVSLDLSMTHKQGSGLKTEMIHATETTLLYRVPGVDLGFYSSEFRTECSETQTGFRNIPIGDHHLGYIQSEIVV